MKVRLNAYRLFLTTTFFLVTSIVTAGTTGKISGTVTDASTWEGLAGANVMVAGSVLGASTDETGYYFIINISYLFLNSLTNQQLQKLALPHPC